MSCIVRLSFICPSYWDQASVYYLTSCGRGKDLYCDADMCIHVLLCTHVFASALRVLYVCVCVCVCVCVYMHHYMCIRVNMCVRIVYISLILFKSTRI